MQFTVQVRALCEKAKEILMEESNVQVFCFTSSCAKLIVLALEIIDSLLGSIEISCLASLYFSWKLE